MRITCAAALYRLLRCFTQEVKVLPGAEEDRQKKPINAEQRCSSNSSKPEYTRKRMATVYSGETHAKIGKYALVDGMTMDFI